MKPIIYISKRCIHCRKLLMMLQQRPQLKGHYQIVSIDDSPFPKTVRSVPCMIIEDNVINSKELFEYILSSDNQQPQQQPQQPRQQQQPQQPPQQQPQDVGGSCAVDDIDGMCLNGNCLDFAPLDDNTNMNSFLVDNFSYLDEPEQKNPSMPKSEQGSEKRQAFDNDYEKMMAERGKIK